MELADIIHHVAPLLANEDVFALACCSTALRDALQHDLWRRDCVAHWQAKAQTDDTAALQFLFAGASLDYGFQWKPIDALAYAVSTHAAELMLAPLTELKDYVKDGNKLLRHCNSADIAAHVLARCRGLQGANGGLTASHARLQYSCALEAAAEKGHQDVAQFLISALGLTVDDVGKSDWYILCIAARKGHLGFLQWLVSAFDIPPNANVRNLLCTAAQYGHGHIVQFVLDAFYPDTGGAASLQRQIACVAAVVSVLQKYILYPYMAHSLSVLQLLHKECKGLDAVKRVGSSFFSTVCSSGNLDLLTFLWQWAGVPSGQELVYMMLGAAKRGNIGCVKFIASKTPARDLPHVVAAGLAEANDVDTLEYLAALCPLTADQFEAALHLRPAQVAYRSSLPAMRAFMRLFAVQAQDIPDVLQKLRWCEQADVVAFLLGQPWIPFEELREQDVLNGYLSTAARLGRASVLREIWQACQRQGIAHPVSTDAAICMFEAAKAGHTAVLSTMLELGICTLADMRLEQNRVLRHAARLGHADMVRLLLARGLGPQDVAASDHYALRWAARKGYMRVIRPLLDCLGDTASLAAHPRTLPYALKWAIYNGHATVVSFLVEHFQLAAMARTAAPCLAAMAHAAGNNHWRVVRYLAGLGCRLSGRQVQAATRVLTRYKAARNSALPPTTWMDAYLASHEG